MKSVSQVSSLRSQVSRALWGCSQMYICHCLCLCLCICHCICLCHCIFVGQVMAAHHSDQMYQRSQVSRTALWGCSLNVFVFVMFFVFVFVFVIFLVMSCLLITLNKCLKGHKSLGLLLGGVLKMSLSLSLSSSIFNGPRCTWGPIYGSESL